LPIVLVGVGAGQPCGRDQSWKRAPCQTGRSDLLSVQGRPCHHRI